MPVDFVLISPAELSTLLKDLLYVGLLAGLFILPKILQRFFIPSAVSALIIGLIWGVTLPEFKHDQTVSFLSSIGILALFLLAGLEVDLHKLKARQETIVVHIAVRGVAIAVTTLLLYSFGDWGIRAACLIALALLTPSTGFILDSLGNLPLIAEEQHWVKEKAIASELFALGLMFFVLQTESVPRLSLSLGVILVLIVIIPLALRFLARHVTPYAPKSEFALLLIGAVICGYITKHLGVYYLVGAFLVGFIVGILRETLPDFHSEQIIGAVGLFSSLFIPFYFFHAGLEIPRAALSNTAILMGALLVLVMVPIRVALIAIPRRWTLHESFRSSLRIATPLMPTLVFTLVLGNILYTQGMIDEVFYGALVFYTLINSLMPQMMFRSERLRAWCQISQTPYTCDQPPDNPLKQG